MKSAKCLRNLSGVFSTSFRNHELVLLAFNLNMVAYRETRFQKPVPLHLDLWNVSVAGSCCLIDGHLSVFFCHADFLPFWSVPLQTFFLVLS